MRRVALLRPKAETGARLRQYEHRSNRMLDFALLVLGLGLFAGGIAYAYACERL
ncbi:MAG TPA: hypothetical protein VGM00_07760 [Bradyrhizobium sp.]|jgi:hypothetical protein